MLGTGTPMPDPNRAGPTALVKAGDTQILLDAGRGVVMRLAAAGTIPPMLNAVLITHFHSDHISALNDVITTSWAMSQGNALLNIYGPVGIAELVDHTLAMLGPDIGYRIAHHSELTEGPKINVTELEPGDSFSVNDVSITTAATEHPPVHPTIGYRLEHEGVSAALVGDTNPCAGVDKLAADADAYLQSVIRKDLVPLIPVEMLQDILDYHSGVVEAAQTASRVGAKRLLLTHMVPAPPPDQYPEWIAHAAKHFDGEIVLGDDLTVVKLLTLAIPIFIRQGVTELATLSTGQVPSRDRAKSRVRNLPMLSISVPPSTTDNDIATKRSSAGWLLVLLTTLLLATGCTGYNTYLMGHSFFAPFANSLDDHASNAGFTNHSQQVLFSGNASGAPEALWNHNAKRSQIQSALDAGDIELFGMTYHPSYPGPDGYLNWVDYALEQNPNTRIFIAIPWLERPMTMNTSTFANTWYTALETQGHALIDLLRSEFDGADISLMPYGEAANCAPRNV